MLPRTLAFSLRTALASERSGRLHGHEREQLQEVVLEHVAQDAGLVVVAAAGADVDVLGHGDLDVGNVAPVPDGLEQRVGEPQEHDVLGGFLPR
jgi:hypothetical protein